MIEIREELAMEIWLAWYKARFPITWNMPLYRHGVIDFGVMA